MRRQYFFCNIFCLRPTFKLLLLLLLRTHSWPRPIKEEVRAIIASHGKRKKKKEKKEKLNDCEPDIDESAADRERENLLADHTTSPMSPRAESVWTWTLCGPSWPMSYRRPCHPSSWLNNRQRPRRQRHARHNRWPPRCRQPCRHPPCPAKYSTGYSLESLWT